MNTSEVIVVDAWSHDNVNITHMHIYLETFWMVGRGDPLYHSCRFSGGWHLYRKQHSIIYAHSDHNIAQHTLTVTYNNANIMHTLKLSGLWGVTPALHHPLPSRKFQGVHIMSHKLYAWKTAQYYYAYNISPINTLNLSVLIEFAGSFG